MMNWNVRAYTRNAGDAEDVSGTMNATRNARIAGRAASVGTMQYAAITIAGVMADPTPRITFTDWEHPS